MFIALAAKKQGLIGAAQHAKKAAADGLVIDAVFNNDIVGGSVGGQGRVDSRTVRVFSEGPEDSPSRQLARFIREAAARYVPAHEVRLIARHDRFGRGGDHSAFNQSGFTGVRFTEAQENYSRQHTVNDTFEGVDPAYLARNARVNAAGLVSLALGTGRAENHQRAGPAAAHPRAGRLRREPAWNRSEWRLGISGGVAGGVGTGLARLAAGLGHHARVSGPDHRRLRLRRCRDRARRA